MIYLEFISAENNQIDYRAKIGSSLLNVAKELFRLSNICGAKCVASFNDTSIIANPGNSIKKLPLLG